MYKNQGKSCAHIKPSQIFFFNTVRADKVLIGLTTVRGIRNKKIKIQKTSYVYTIWSQVLIKKKRRLFYKDFCSYIVFLKDNDLHE
jgi:hypothetical protein